MKEGVTISRFLLLERERERGEVGIFFWGVFLRGNELSKKRRKVGGRRRRRRESFSFPPFLKGQRINQE